MFKLGKSKGRLNFTIKNHLIRYVYSSTNHLEDIEDAGEIPLPSHIMEDGKVVDAVEFAQIIEHHVEVQDWKNADLYFNVPDHSVVIRPFQIPSSLAEDEIKGYLYMQIGETLHLPYENPAFDYSIMSREEEHTNLLLFSYPDDQIRMLERVFKEAKLRPKAVDISALSIYRLYEALDYADRDEHLLLVDWNLDGCVLTVFYQAQPVFINHTKSPLPLNLWKQEGETCSWKGDTADPLDFTMDQMTEIDRIMDFYRFSVMNGKASVTKVLVTGDWPLKQTVKEEYEKRSLPVQIFQKDDLRLEEDRSVNSEYVDTVGLALKS
ncbi:type IV pilus biogenesis protein PilM [Halobacillus yeomjeoni]|uniref:Pilus assembly protein PilM n=1 Tax=Halobacillus yeomjeoni TaxID=311194 RepID=A0A931MV68_9BACI|nr:pilus assembly protein PilM [Halobacillus yeomjeoni]MBH0230024.1 pilus assembly protein PilM [Halobacillus yeomjeoni]